MRVEPEPVVVEHVGLRIAALDWGGEGPTLLLLHPNGFCAGLFDPLAQRLRGSFRCVGVDLRGHGGTDVPPGLPAAFPVGVAFVELAADVVAVLDHLGVGQPGTSEVVALGESSGGGVATLVDAARPGLIRRLMLCEAIAFDIGALGASSSGSGPGDGGNYMAALARKRRAVWPSRAEVRASYGSRPPMNELAPETLDAYVRWGFVDRADGTVELACPPEFEATMFEAGADPSGALEAWRHLSALTASAVVLSGNRSNLPPAWFAAQAERAGCPHVEIDGGHFFLQEDTDRAESLVREHLA